MTVASHGGHTSGAVGNRHAGRGIFAIASLATLAAFAGLVLVALMLFGGGPAIGLQTEASAGELSVWVDRYEWLEHDHDAHDHGDDEDEESEPDPTSQALDEIRANAGFAMPSRMMPGTPDEGFQRLQVNLNVLSQGAAQPISPDDFRLESTEGKTWPSLLGGTFVPTSLDTGQALSTVVAFDVPYDDAALDMFLIWTNGVEELRFSLNGSTHAH